MPAGPWPPYPAPDPEDPDEHAGAEGPGAFGGGPGGITARARPTWCDRSDSARARRGFAPADTRGEPLLRLPGARSPGEVGAAGTVLSVDGPFSNRRPPERLACLPYGYWRRAQSRSSAVSNRPRSTRPAMAGAVRSSHSSRPVRDSRDDGWVNPEDSGEAAAVEGDWVAGIDPVPPAAGAVGLDGVERIGRSGSGTTAEMTGRSGCVTWLTVVTIGATVAATGFTTGAAAWTTGPINSTTGSAAVETTSTAVAAAWTTGARTWDATGAKACATGLVTVATIGCRLGRRAPTPRLRTTDTAADTGFATSDTAEATGCATVETTGSAAFAVCGHHRGHRVRNLRNHRLGRLRASDTTRLGHLAARPRRHHRRLLRRRRRLTRARGRLRRRNGLGVGVCGCRGRYRRSGISGRRSRQGDLTRDGVHHSRGSL